MSKVSGASAALEVLRQAGLKVSTDRRQESNGAQYEMRELKISAPIATPKPSRQFADQRKAARAILHCAQILSDDVPKRPDVEIPLLFTANCGYSATLIVSDSEEPKVTLKPLNGAWAKYTYYVSTLLKIDRAGGELGAPFYLDFGANVWIDSGVFYAALRRAVAQMPKDYGSFEIHWKPFDHRMPF
jgi:hypothetical protein